VQTSIKNTQNQETNQTDLMCLLPL